MNLSLQKFSANEDFILKNKRFIARIEAFDAIAFTQINVKLRYDCWHLSLFMRINDWVLLRLHKNYNISIIAQIKKKISNQYIELFRITKRIERFTYRLVVLEHWRIHSVFIIAQLKFYSFFEANSFHRSRFTHFDFVYVNDDISKMKSWKLSSIINKRHNARESKYLIRWKEYEKQYDEWRDLSKMRNVMKLIKKYEKVINDDNSDNLLSSSKFFASKKHFADIIDDFIKSRERSRKIVIAISIIAVIMRKLTITTSILDKQSSSSETSLSSTIVLRKLIVVVFALTEIEFIASPSSKTFALKTLKKVFDNALRRFTRLLKSKNKS